MVKHKIIFALGGTILFLALAMAPATTACGEESEVGAVNALFDQIEEAFLSSTTMREFLRKILDIWQSCDFLKFPILQSIMEKIMEWLTKERSSIFGGE